MKMARVLALALSLVLGLVSSGPRVGAEAQQPTDQSTTGISSEALAQIDALIAEKDGRTSAQQKIDSQLIYERKMEGGQPIADGIWAIETDLPYAGDGHLIVDVRARDGSDLASRLPGAGIEIVWTSDDGSSLRAHVNIDQVETLAADPDVVFIQPRQGAMTAGLGQQAEPNIVVGPTGVGSRSSEGDITHLAFAARGAFHINGTGVKIGALSDGVSHLAASQASGDLGPVTVLPGQAGNGDEGTAMLEIIHDLAPGAQLYFATAFNGISSFAQNIRALRAAGCDIIVDDVFYFVETPFQDGQASGVVSNTNGGVVIQAVNDVTADGAMYFSSAGNSGNLDAGTSGTWEGDFVDGAATAAPLASGNRLHNFGAQNFNVITVATTNPINLYWSDPLGGSSNDYDLFRLNAAGTTVLASSTNIQTGIQDPYEQVTSGGASPAAVNQRLVIVKKAAAAGRFLHLGTNRARLSIATAGQTHGHAAAADSFGVAATPAAGPYPQIFNSGNVVELFSSDGPRRVFYQSNGTPYSPGNLSSSGGLLRQKPDITAADGVSVTGVGPFPSPFFGTSAAAPHAAAIAALVKSANLALTPAQIRTILTSTAIDIQAAGVDRDSGAGIIMARAAVGATGASGTAFLVVDSIVTSDHPGNGNGLPEAGEGAKFVVTLKNYGATPATAIAAALTSPTAGITIAQPNAVSYPDLPPFASAPNTGQLLFTAASDFGCPAAAIFSLNALYSGGVGPLSQAFSLPIGVTSYRITRSLDGTVPPMSPGVTTAAGVQVGRLFRDGVASACGVQKTINSGIAANPVDAAFRRFESYQFNTCPTSNASCATVTLQGANAITLFTAAYTPTFNSSSILQNYKADPGTSAASRTYSFDVGGGTQAFAVDVHDVPVTNPPSPSPTPSGNVYTLTVSGVCMGACDPPNHPPVARARSVTAAANNLCVAESSIDDGSSDADSDPLTLAQAPLSPYPLGTTSVLLTATDPKGAFSQASGSVTVLDRTPPSIACPAPIATNTASGLCSAAVTFAPPTGSDLCSNPTTVSTDVASGASFPVGTTTVKGRATDTAGNDAFCTTTVTVVDNEPPAISGLSLSPARRLERPNHKMVGVTVNYVVSDNCGSSSCVLTVTSNEPPHRPDDGDDDERDRDRDHDHAGPEWVVVDAHHVLLRAEGSEHGRGRIYTITLTCTDPAGNRTVRMATVSVPHDRR
jgi:hypothetical protein